MNDNETYTIRFTMPDGEKLVFHSIFTKRFRVNPEVDFAAAIGVSFSEGIEKTIKEKYNV